MDTFYVLDTLSIFRRGHGTVRPIHAPDGRPTGAIQHFCRFLLHLSLNLRPDFLAAALDGSKVPPRPEDAGAGDLVLPDELEQQLPHIRRILEAFNIPAFQVENARSSDVVSVLVQLGASAHRDVCVVAADREFAQLAGTNVRLWNPISGRTTTEQDVGTLYGVLPECVPDYLVLTGESADGSAGVPGVGEKTAQDLLRRFGCLEGILEHLANIEKPRVREGIRDQEDLLRLSIRLARFDRGVPVDVEMDRLRFRDPDWARVLEILREFELPGLARMVPCHLQRRPVFRVAKTPADLDDFMKSADDELAIRVDAETPGVALACSTGAGLYVPLPSVRADALTNGLRKVLEAPGIRKTGLDLLHDSARLLDAGIRLGGLAFDARLADGLLVSGHRAHGLDDLSFVYLGRTHAEVEPGDPGLNRQVEVCENARLAIELRKVLEPRLEKDHLDSVLKNLDLPSIPSLSGLHHRGALVRPDRFREVAEALSEAAGRALTRAAFFAGEEFDPEDRKTLEALLFVKLRLSPLRKSAEGYDLDDGTLEELSEEHELPCEILEYRHLHRFAHFTSRTLAAAVGPDSRLRMEGMALSGEWITDRNEPWADRLREGFCAPAGRRLVSARIPDPEIRLLAHMSQAPALLSACRKGRDVRTGLTSALHPHAEDKADSAMHRKSAGIARAFALNHSPGRLAREVGMPIEEARRQLDGFMKAFSGLQGFLDSLAGQIQIDGAIRNLFGRRFTPAATGRRGKQGAGVLRDVLANAIRGTLSDLMKIAMIRLDQALEAEGLQARPVLLGPGEILVEAPANESDRVSSVCLDSLEHAVGLTVPLPVLTGTAEDWSAARKPAASG